MLEHLDRHLGNGVQGAYVLQASYTDGGTSSMPPLTASRSVVLRHPQIEMEDYAEGNVGVVIATLNTAYVSYISNIRHGKYVRYDGIDLTGIGAVSLRLQEHGAGGTVSVHLDAVEGTEVGRLTVPAGQLSDLKTGWKDVRLPIQPTTGRHHLYFVFKNPDTKQTLFHIDRMIFERR